MCNGTKMYQTWLWLGYYQHAVPVWIRLVIGFSVLCILVSKLYSKADFPNPSYNVKLFIDQQQDNNAGLHKRREHISLRPQNLPRPASGAWSDFETIFENLNPSSRLRWQCSSLNRSFPYITYMCSYTIGKFLQFAWHDLLHQVCQWKTCIKRFNDVHFILNLVIIGICLGPNSCGSTASSVLEASIQCCVKSVLKRLDNLLYINIWNNTGFCKNVTQF